MTGETVLKNGIMELGGSTAATSQISMVNTRRGSRGGQMGHLTYVKIAKQIINIPN